MVSPYDDEMVPRLVSNYYFLDEKESQISFAVLPICRSESERSDDSNRLVFLCGIADDGSQEVCKQVTSWRLRFQDEQPQVWVLSKEGKWIKLLKPRSSYKNRFRTLMVTLQWLYFLKRKPEYLEKTLWHNLHKVFSSFEVRPSKQDLADHVSLIKLFADRDKALANSQLLSRFLKEKLGKRSTSCVVAETESAERQPSIGCVNDMEEDQKDADGDEFEESKESSDSVCAICDNGGEIICCDGRCRRSFHATKGAGRKAGCESLGYSRTEVQAMHKFFCKNCQYKQHQCFACGKLGSSEKTSQAEVFPCGFASCGHFYHSKCIAELLFQEKGSEARNFQSKVAAGDSFICPYHNCAVCKQGENKKIYELQFAICRRCPRSYHRKCLPRKIPFKDSGQGILQRAWDGLLPNRILIYCLKHEIDEDLRSPLRNHIIFPKIPVKKNKWILPKAPKKNKMKNSLNGECSEDLSKEHISVEPSKLIEKLPHAVDSCYRVQPTKKVKTSKESKPSDNSNLSSINQTRYSTTEVSANVAGEELNGSFPEIDRESIYRKHELDEKLQAPQINNIIFPKIPEKNKQILNQVPEKNKTKNSLKKRKCVLHQVPKKNKTKNSLKKRKRPEDLCKEQISVGPSKFIEKLPHAVDSCFRAQPDRINTKKVKISKERKSSDHHNSSFIDRTTDSAPKVTATMGGEEPNGLFPERDSESIDRKPEIDENLWAPLRNHVIFPKKTLKKKDKILPKVPEKNKRKNSLKKRKCPKDLSRERISIEPSKLIEKLSHSADRCDRLQPDRINTKKAKFSKPVSLVDPTTDSAPEVSAIIAGEELNGSFPEIDSESIDRIKVFMHELSSLLESEDVNKKSRIESSHDFSLKHTDLRIKQGKVEGSFEAILTTRHNQKGGEPEELILGIDYSTNEPVQGKAQG